MDKKNITLILMLISLLLLSSCNTIHGIGKDVQRVGESIERATDK